MALNRHCPVVELSIVLRPVEPLKTSFGAVEPEDAHRLSCPT